jgi:hypothetical protein
MGRREAVNRFLFDDIFTIDPDQYYMYKHDGEWICDGKSSFVRPVEADNSLINKGSKYEPLVGKVIYPSPYLKSIGIKNGDNISFAPNSEYEFKIDGETLYRIYNSHLIAKL